MVEFEKRGVPTVSWVARGFDKDAQRSAENFGVPTLAMAHMPLPFTNQSPEIINNMVSAGIDDVIQGLTESPENSGADAGFTTVTQHELSFEGKDLLEAMEAMNRQFLDWRWSDGFPLIPPTADRVELMMKGSNRAPQDIIAKLEPGFGVATVQKLAANAVMAGCRPEHLLVLITAVQCISEPQMYLRNKAMSTGPHAPLILVNGPIARALGINTGCARWAPDPSPTPTASSAGRCGLS